MFAIPNLPAPTLQKKLKMVFQPLNLVILFCLTSSIVSERVVITTTNSGYDESNPDNYFYLLDKVLERQGEISAASLTFKKGIEKIGDSAFNNMVNLKKLTLKENSLTSLENIQTNVFGKLDSLTEISLEDNSLSLTDSQESTFGLESDSLCILQFSGNPLSDLSFLRNSKLPSLESIPLARLNMATIVSGTFANFPQLTHIEVKDNKKLVTLETGSLFVHQSASIKDKVAILQNPIINELPSGIFNAGPKINSLYVYQNSNLQSIQPGIFDNIDISTLLIQNNAITSLEYGLFNENTPPRGEKYITFQLTENALQCCKMNGMSLLNPPLDFHYDCLDYSDTKSSGSRPVDIYEEYGCCDQLKDTDASFFDETSKTCMVCAPDPYCNYESIPVVTSSTGQEAYDPQNLLYCQINGYLSCPSKSCASGSSLSEQVDKISHPDSLTTYAQCKACKAQESCQSSGTNCLLDGNLLQCIDCDEGYYADDTGKCESCIDQPSCDLKKSNTTNANSDTGDSNTIIIAASTAAAVLVVAIVVIIAFVLYRIKLKSRSTEKKGPLVGVTTHDFLMGKDDLNDPNFRIELQTDEEYATANTEIKGNEDNNKLDKLEDNIVSPYLVSEDLEIDKNDLETPYSYYADPDVVSDDRNVDYATTASFEYSTMDGNPDDAPLEYAEVTNNDDPDFTQVEYADVHIDNPEYTSVTV